MVRWLKERRECLSEWWSEFNIRCPYYDHNTVVFIELNLKSLSGRRHHCWKLFGRLHLDKSLVPGKKGLSLLLPFYSIEFLSVHFGLNHGSECLCILTNVIWGITSTLDHHMWHIKTFNSSFWKHSTF